MGLNSALRPAFNSDTTHGSNLYEARIMQKKCDPEKGERTQHTSGLIAGRPPRPAGAADRRPPALGPVSRRLPCVTGHKSPNKTENSFVKSTQPSEP
ncbi:hypothetical protein EVAR_98244_1 [Eumeta japonica]|uniref:Uncharacterized protein n=1 Tax=Eumeta variegata TaxID=151549 RepID=A0A4C1Y2X6_EUMVA|nr:hypothetical protein EVAR_98244_1 [Eumeta japonica]